MDFINRTAELKILNEKWVKKDAEFIIVYGKRRVGKTELLKKFLRNIGSDNDGGIYFLADKRTLKDQLRELGRLFGHKFDDDILSKRGFNDMLEVFEYMKAKCKKRFLFIVDEYPYLLEADGSIGSIFQKGWDEYLKDSKVFLVLCGSSISMMESETLAYKSPLYGRRTGQLLMHPMTFVESRKFFPKISFGKFLSIYSVTGGMPAYLSEFAKQKNLKDAIQNLVLNKMGFLHNEIEFILREELRDPKNYLAILKAIAFSKTKFNEISVETGLEKNILNKYLSVLQNLKLVEKEIPVTEKNPGKSHKGIYKLSEPFLKFWFRHVYPYKSDLEIGEYKAAESQINKNFHSLEETSYEIICREILKAKQDKVFPIQKIGRWWENDQEIDLVGLNDDTKEIVFGEAKWSNKPMGVDILENLERKAGFVGWNKKNRKERYALFSKSGFDSKLKAIAGKEKVILFKQDKFVRGYKFTFRSVDSIFVFEPRLVYFLPVGFGSIAFISFFYENFYKNPIV